MGEINPVFRLGPDRHPSIIGSMKVTLNRPHPPTLPFWNTFRQLLIWANRVEIIVKSSKLSRSRTVTGGMVQHYVTPKPI